MTRQPVQHRTLLVTVATGELRRSPTVPSICSPHPTYRRQCPPKRSNDALQMLPLRPVSVAVSAYVGGVARPPISLIPFEPRNTMIMRIMTVQILYDFFKIQKH